MKLTDKEKHILAKLIRNNMRDARDEKVLGVILEKLDAFDSQALAGNFRI